MKKLKLKIKNETHYRTADLRQFFLAAMKAHGCWSQVESGVYTQIIEVGYCGPNTYASGKASISGCWIRMKLPRTKKRLDAHANSLAQVFCHELDHNKGLRRERDMLPLEEHGIAWAEGLEIREQEEKTKPKRNLVAEREAHARKLLEKHVRKLKRQQGLVKKWRAKVRYYDKRTAAKVAEETGR